jgi:hypothetical protein
MSKPENAADPAPGSEPKARPSACPVAWCPVCLAVSVAQPIAPDVITHLLKAGTEMFLAFQAVIETRADDLDGREPAEPVRVEKIDVG